MLKKIHSAVFDALSDSSCRALSSECPPLGAALVPVRVTCDAKGSILPFSLLCAPDALDLERLFRRRSNADPWTPPEEPVHRVSDEHREHLRKAVKKAGRDAGVARFPVSVDDPETVVKD